MPSKHVEPNQPFNDAMDHLNKVEGYPITKPKNLPFPIKLIGYVMFGGIFLFGILGVVWSLFK